MEKITTASRYYEHGEDNDSKSLLRTEEKITTEVVTTNIREDNDRSRYYEHGEDNDRSRYYEQKRR
ncbi:MAG: hypothetical protein ACRC8Y_13375 [Chroococcales cyanobacterium]